MTKQEALREQFKRALDRLQEVLLMPKNDVVRDAAIKRFEFVFDLAWKYLKVRLEEEKGIICRSPKDCFREAYRQGLIDYDEFWLELTDRRNETAHTYDEKIADRVYACLSEAFPRFQRLLLTPP